MKSTKKKVLRKLKHPKNKYLFIHVLDIMRILLSAKVTCFALFFIGSFYLSYAQKAKVTSANSYLTYGEIDKAKEAIDLATTHEKSLNLAKTWFIRGKVYHAIYESKDMAINTLDPKSLLIAYESYIKALKLDVKDRFGNDVHKKLEICSMQFINQGVTEYSAGQYNDALISFQNSLSINAMPKFNKVDTLSIYNAALTAEKLAKNELAKEYYNKLLKYKYGGAKIYYFLLNILKKENNKDELLEMIKKARNDFPDDNNLIIEELNYYIESGEKDKAISNLEQAIESDKENYNLYYALGAIYDEVGSFDKSVNMYDRALTLVEPKLKESKELYKLSIGSDKEANLKLTLDKVHEMQFNILYNYGALYFNYGVKRIQDISNLTDNKKYGIEKKKAEEVMVKALPYLESALELKPTDRNTLISLKDLYARTDNKEAWNRVQDKLEN